MRISYNKLWKMLIDKNMKKSDLKPEEIFSMKFRSVYKELHADRETGC